MEIPLECKHEWEATEHEMGYRVWQCEGCGKVADDERDPDIDAINEDHYFKSLENNI